ncbi:lysosomal Pro-X carboxypeptidase [Condylostylus longicornis]|uniref:lysosomal Pro-X carboxypeptidase n=1 Tax=Condylostylus longicornis TaxID=2530218 RepID=UPI00244D9AC4|nr:lysosomal Pro-X carboxypeptidase [Condylostylus longicornis]
MHLLNKLFLLIFLTFQCNEILNISAIISSNNNNNNLYNGPKDYLYTEKYINVPLDHFSFTNQTTFKLRYLINETYSSGRSYSPIFFYTGNEGDIELFAQNTGFMWEAAKQMQAAVIFAEHRYYGKSLPFGSMSFNSSTYSGYLSAEQALADYATLLYNITNGKYDSRPIIAFGGSYGGMLAAWFRMKYPHIIIGALAASAPILQFTGLTPCDIYSRIVTSVFKVADKPECVENIINSWDMFKNFSSNDKGRQILNNKYKFCKNVTKTDDITNEFFEYLNDMYSNLAMANYPYQNEFLAPLPAYPVRMFCGQLEKLYQGEELLNAMHNAISIYANYTGKLKCLDYSTAFEPNMGDLGWNFQSCTEMVMPMCNKNSMFPKSDWNFKGYSDKCFKQFGVRPNEHEILMRYGGKQIDSASNIIFSNGLLDPWSSGGVLKSNNDKINIIIIPEGAHHIDLRAANPDDPASVINARIQELSIIENWITEYYFSRTR